MNMRGGLVAGPAYLLRLSLSPTEEDWVDGAETKRWWYGCDAAAIAAAEEVRARREILKELFRESKSPARNAGFYGSYVVRSANSQMFVRNAALRFFLWAPGPEVQRSA